ncbi:glycogen synthase GlgA [Thermodesulfobacteriota bacterium]
MNVLFVASEVVPFSKTGGLADVAGALPPHLKQCGCDIRVVTPYYKAVVQGRHSTISFVKELVIPLGELNCSIQLFETVLKNSVKVYLVKCDEFFWRDNLYGTTSGDYEDNAERFILFARAVVEICLRIRFAPAIIHCNDWQAGLVPAYIKTIYQHEPCFSKTAFVFSIHNIAYQGLFEAEAFDLTGLPAHLFSIGGCEYWGKLSMIKAGIVFSDIITTVSKKYSREIQTTEYGYGLEGILRERSADLYGILNGIDYDDWHPRHDPHISARYSLKSLWRKKICKQALIEECGLAADVSARPLIGIISRLADQKGFDLIAKRMSDIIMHGAAVVLLGTGDAKYERLFRCIGKRYPGRTSMNIMYDNRLAHKIEAGCDMFLMPSRYEPCGLNQMYSLAYGTVPIVRATGGLDDTIVDVDEEPSRGTGYKFDSYDDAQLMAAIRRACSAFEDPKRWRQILLSGMRCDFSWDRSAREYIRLYEDARRRKG